MKNWFDKKKRMSRRWALTHKPINEKIATNDWRKWEAKN
jgi:hypothetical protein